MSRTRQVLWASILSGGSVFAATAASLVLLKLATNHLSMADYGTLVLVQFWADALIIFVNFGLATSLPRLIAATPAEDRHALVASALTGTGALAMLVALLLGALMFSVQTTWSPLAMWILPLFVVGMLRDTALAALAGLHRYSSRAMSLIVASVLGVAIAGTLVALGHASVGAFAGALAAGHALNLGWLYYALPPDARWRWDPPQFRLTLRDSRALYQNQSLTFLVQRLDTFLAERLLSLEAVSLLGAVKQFPVLLSRVLGALLVPLLPNLAALIAAGDRDTATQVMNRALRLVAVLGYSAVLLCAGMGAILLTLVSSPTYAIAAPLVLWMMSAMALAVQAGIAGQGLIALGLPALITRCNLATAALAVALNLICLPRYGYTGAGYAAVAAGLLGMVLQSVLVHRGGLAVAWHPWLKVHALFAVACAVAWCVPWPSVTLCVAALLFPLGCLLTGGLPWAECQALLAALIGRRKALPR